MKKTLIALFSLPYIICSAQITTREISQKEVAKPIQYDSIADYNQIKDVYQLTGQTIYFLPTTKETYHSETSMFSSITDFNDTLYYEYKEKKLFSGIQNRKKLYHEIRFNIHKNNKNVSPVYQYMSDYNAIGGHYFIVLSIEAIKKNNNNEFDQSKDLWLKLLNKELKDTAYLHVVNVFSNGYYSKDYRDIIVLGCYEKNKQRIGTKYQIQKEFDTLDLKTGKEIFINDKSWWKCIDVSIINLENSTHLAPALIITNDDGNEIAVDYNNMLFNQVKSSSFLSELEVKNNEIKQKEDENQQALNEKQKIDRIQKEDEAVKKDLISKFGDKFGMIIYNQNLIIGMTKEMCLASWGQPYFINKETTKHGASEQWIYSLGKYLFFSGDYLTAIQNLE